MFLFRNASCAESVLVEFKLTQLHTYNKVLGNPTARKVTTITSILKVTAGRFKATLTGYLHSMAPFGKPTFHRLFVIVDGTDWELFIPASGPFRELYSFGLTAQQGIKLYPLKRATPLNMKETGLLKCISYRKSILRNDLRRDCRVGPNVYITGAST